MATRDQFRGCILGLAIGDALGFPAEFRSRQAVLDTFGPAGITDFVASSSHPPGTYTDDTQMSIAVAEGLLDVPSDASLDAMMGAVATRFVTWSRSPQNNRAPGGTCMKGCAALARGVDWRSAGVANSKGCGSAMRVAPIGLLFAVDPRQQEVARASSILTHGHDAAIEGAAAAAFGVAHALSGAEPLRLFTEVVELTAGKSADFDRCLRRLWELRDEPPEVVLTRAGVGEAWVAEEAFASALYCYLRTPDDFSATVLCGTNTDGDSDSIAAIAGSFSGARLGMSALPESWVDRVEDRDHLIDLADRLYDRAVS